MKKILSILLLTVIVLAGCKRPQQAHNPKATAKSDKPINVVVSNLEKRDLKSYIEFSAQPEGITDITVNSQVSGEITNIYKTMGDKVKKGEKIAEIDNEDYKIQKMQADANLSAAKANYDTAKRQYDANKNLYDDKIISQSEFESSLSRLSSVDASVKMAKANLKKTEKMLNNSMFIAPESGIINYIFVKKGELVSMGKPICAIVDPLQLVIKGGISQRDISSVKKGQPVTVYSENHKTLTGKITAVGIKPIDGANYPVEILLDNKSRSILPGMVVKVKILSNIYKNVLYLPKRYIRDNLGEKYVYLAIGNSAKKQKIITEREVEENYIIKSGLSENDKIIIEGIDKIEDNSKIKIIERSL